MRALVLVAIVACHHGGADTQIHVDRRVETIAILERLAGAPEYKTAAVTPYMADIDTDLANYANHPAVLATRALGKGFEQPMRLAVGTDDTFTQVPDLGWTGVDVAAYLAQVRAFVADTKLDTFFA